MRYVLAPLAEDDLLNIWCFIAADSSDAADKVLKRLQAELRRLSEFPQLGHSRADVTIPGLLFWRVYSYLIAYRPKDGELQVARIIHGSRDIPNIFDT